MSNSDVTIWCNANLGPSARALLEEGVKPHRLVVSTQLSSSNLVASAADPALAEADVAFGQPDSPSVIGRDRLIWVHLTSAGYSRYDTETVRGAIRARGAQLTTSSQVYADPCAQHVLAFMLAAARQLPQALDAQRMERSWRAVELRANSQLLTGQNMVLLGFGAIARRLVELVAPLRLTISALRRKGGVEGGVARIAPEHLREALAKADHIVNTLPENPGTQHYVDAVFLEGIKAGAVFYNVGRGSTVDQEALMASLSSGHLAAAYLDVTDPEPLPPDHPLWSAPNCVITPHTAGGFAGEEEALVRHFLENLQRWTAGESLIDRVI